MIDYNGKVLPLSPWPAVHFSSPILSNLKINVHSDHSEPEFVLFTDASLTGWGCPCEIGRTGGHWDYAEVQSNINVLELKAALLGLRSFAREKANIHVRFMMDNTTAVACVSKMGTSHSGECNAVTKEIWQFCIKRQHLIVGSIHTRQNKYRGWWGI